jgi:hypothetical protein
MTDYPDYSIVCPGCDKDVDVRITKFYPEEPMSRDYPGCPPDVEFEFKCACGFDDSHMSWHEASVLKENLIEHVAIQLQNRKEAGEEAKFEAWYEEHRLDDR